MRTLARGDFFLVIVNTLHFDSLKSWLLSRLQQSRSAKACCKFLQSPTDVMDLYSLVSSAHKAANVYSGNMLGRSFMNITKETGPGNTPSPPTSSPTQLNSRNISLTTLLVTLFTLPFRQRSRIFILVF